jgi:hypothetical protein
MLIAAALLTVGAILFTLLVRSKDLPPPEVESPVAHLDERRGRIYEGLRDLQFEYRVGKLSEADYQRTKLSLQQDLARVMAEIDVIKGRQPVPPAPKSPASAPPQANKCPHCGAIFKENLKFCGECGKPMTGGAA